MKIKIKQGVIVMGKMNDIFTRIVEMNHYQREHLKRLGNLTIKNSLIKDSEIASELTFQYHHMRYEMGVDSSVLDYLESECNKMAGEIEKFIKDGSTNDHGSVLSSYKMIKILNGLSFNQMFSVTLCALRYELNHLYCYPQSVTLQVDNECDIIVKNLNDMFWNNLEYVIPCED